MSSAAEPSRDSAGKSPRMEKPTSLLAEAKFHAQTVLLFTKSDHFTFVLPESFFGLCALVTHARELDLDARSFWQRALAILAWNWLNTFVFAVSNQSNTLAAREDAVNKAWRPIPAGRISISEARGLLLIAIPILLAASALILGAYTETATLLCLTWMYNDLDGSDGNFVVRNLIVAVAYYFYGRGSVQVGVGYVSSGANMWLTMTSAVIFCTIAVQDLKDQAGDRGRGRKTAPIVLGDARSRQFIALSIVFWSWPCCAFWKMSLLCTAIFVAVSLGLALRILFMRGFAQDRLSWKLWAAWVLSIYSFPMCTKILHI